MPNAPLAALLLLAGVNTVMAMDAPLPMDRLAARQRTGRAPLLLDVRHGDEFRDGHRAGALNIPVEQLASRAGAPGVPRGREIVVYCVSGRRAALAQERLAGVGLYPRASAGRQPPCMAAAASAAGVRKRCRFKPFTLTSFHG